MQRRVIVIDQRRTDLGPTLIQLGERSLVVSGAGCASLSRPLQSLVDGVDEKRRNQAYPNVAERFWNIVPIYAAQFTRALHNIYTYG